MIRFAVALAVTFGLSPNALAQSAYTQNTLKLDSAEARPPASIQDVAWMAGYWTGEGLGGIIEEIWTPPLGSTMTGAFKLSRADTVVFYELMTFVEEDNSISLWVKHFNPDFSGWEERHDKVAFPLVRLDPDAAYFQGLTFKRAGDGALDVYLAMTRRGGDPREAHLIYRRADLPSK